MISHNKRNYIKHLCMLGLTYGRFLCGTSATAGFGPRYLIYRQIEVLLCIISSGGGFKHFYFHPY